jgi:Coenzyme PQQ synthesis protein D (PqqD)
VNASLRLSFPVRKRDLWLRQSDSENAIYDPATGEVHLLNSTALAIWVLCDGRTTPTEMIQAVCDLSRLPEDVAEEDVMRALVEFGHAGILTWREFDRAGDEAEGA